MPQLNKAAVNEFAIASLTIAILSFLQLAGFEKAILAIVLGVLALRRIAAPGAQVRGEGLAAAGIVLGVIYCLVAGIAIYNFIKNPEALQQLLNQQLPK
ncbi:DUF4190 domain-containing protein [Candidatus Omnitrophota bacterium]